MAEACATSFPGLFNFKGKIPGNEVEACVIFACHVPCRIRQTKPLCGKIHSVKLKMRQIRRKSEILEGFSIISILNASVNVN